VTRRLPDSLSRMRPLSLVVVALATSLAACGAPRTAAPHRAVPVPAAAPAAQPDAPPEPSRAHLGPRDPIAVGSVARSRDAELQFCYLEGVKRHPDLAGRLTVHVRIAGSGRVTEVAVESRSWDRGKAKDVEACVLSKIARWQFDESAERTAVYPLILLFSR
jgi:hypothetical protein